MHINGGIFEWITSNEIKCIVQLLIFRLIRGLAGHGLDSIQLFQNKLC